MGVYVFIIIWSQIQLMQPKNCLLQVFQKNYMELCVGSPMVPIVRRSDPNGEKLIVARGINDGDTLNAIFGAFEKYKRLYNYDMPSSTLEVAKKLIDHPSESVKIDAFSVLSESVGTAILPVLFNELETTRSLGVVNILIMKILSLDQSDETVRRLKEIAAKTPEETGKVRFIETYTNPKNIERLRNKRK